MSKELPYFKFEPNQWENGNIQICNRADKGLFMDLCCMYWSRLGDVPFKLAVQKLCGGNASAFDSLLEENIFTVIDGDICIEFLNEQLQEFDDTKSKNRQNALIGWEKRRKQRALSERNASALITQRESDAIREDKSIEDKIKEKKIIENKNKTLLSEIKISDLENDDVEYFEIAKAFNDLFIKNLNEKQAPTKNQINATFKNYVDPIRLMMTNDGVSKEQLTKVFKYLDSPEGDFWKPNILSTKKLREKFAQLIIKSQTNNGKKQSEQRTNEEIARDAFNSDTAKQFRFS